MSAMATRSVSRPPPVVSAKCLKSNRPLLVMLLLPPTSCTKPVMVQLPGDDAGVVAAGEAMTKLATARSDKAPMLPAIGQGRGASGRPQDNAGGR